MKQLVHVHEMIRDTCIHVECPVQGVFRQTFVHSQVEAQTICQFKRQSTRKLGPYDNGLWSKSKSVLPK